MIIGFIWSLYINCLKLTKKRKKGWYKTYSSYAYETPIIMLLYKDKIMNQKITFNFKKQNIFVTWDMCEIEVRIPNAE